MNILVYNGPVAGVSYANPDFTQLSIGDPVYLVPEPENEYDARAVRVEHPRAGKLGYLPAEQTAVFHENVDATRSFGATIYSTDIGPRYSKIFIRVVLTIP